MAAGSATFRTSEKISLAKKKPDIITTKADGIGAITSSSTDATKTPITPHGKIFISKKCMSVSIICIAWKPPQRQNHQNISVNLSSQNRIPCLPKWHRKRLLWLCLFLANASSTFDQKGSYQKVPKLCPPLSEKALHLFLLVYLFEKPHCLYYPFAPQKRRYANGHSPNFDELVPFYLMINL